MEKELRKLLNIPDELRIGQFLMNVFQEENEVGNADTGYGIDIFYLDDKQFMFDVDKWAEDNKE